jgi:hypothetical protein
MTVKIKSLELDKPQPEILLPPHKVLDITSYFFKSDATGKPVMYLRDTLLSERFVFYALPASMFQKYQEVPPEAVTNPLDVHETYGDGRFQLQDITDLMVDYSGKFKTQITDITAKTVTLIKSGKPGKFIDGFKATSVKRKDRIK